MSLRRELEAMTAEVMGTAGDIGRTARWTTIALVSATVVSALALIIATVALVTR